MLIFSYVYTYWGDKSRLPGQLYNISFFYYLQCKELRRCTCFTSGMQYDRVGTTIETRGSFQISQPLGKTGKVPML